MSMGHTDSTRTCFTVRRNIQIKTGNTHGHGGVARLFYDLHTSRQDELRIDSGYAAGLNVKCRRWPECECLLLYTKREKVGAYVAQQSTTH
jgi:hypothetical protein